MNFDSQDLAALSIVALACGYLLRQGWLLVRRKQPPGGCGGGCAKCPSSATEKPLVVLALDLSSRSAAPARHPGN